MKIRRLSFHALFCCSTLAALVSVLALDGENPASSPASGVTPTASAAIETNYAALPLVGSSEAVASVLNPMLMKTEPAEEASLAERFATSEDLGALAELLSELMDRGDGEAAYYLHRIGELCGYRWNKDQTNESAALDTFERDYLDSLESSTGDPYLADWIFKRERDRLKRAWQVCPESPLSEPDLQSDALIESAAGLGFPLAMALRAQRLLYFPSHSATPHPLASEVREAAMSRDPQTLYEIAKAISFGGIVDQRNKRLARAWILVACWHGLDCGPDGDVVREHICPNDAEPGCMPGVDLETYFQLWNPDEYMSTFDLAKQIWRAFSDGRWNDLEL